MPSLIPGYNYDIFISYRQKDNKYDGWVTEFVDNLKKELEATFKEEISLYFDINPHDGLLETHDVDESLKEKLKCLIFIPIISRTYCDPKSFAWEHEFKAFVEMASNDQFGLKAKLPNGNVASRVLPIRIHDLDIADIKECESVLKGVLRGVEFVYKEPGVNRSLTPKDHEERNLSKTNYRNQINKVALAIKELIQGLSSWPTGEVKGEDQPKGSLKEAREGRRINLEKSTKTFRFKSIVTLAIVTLVIIAGIIAYPKIFKRNTLKRLRESGERISVVVMPFLNMTNDTAWNIWQNGIQDILITYLSNYTEELKVQQPESINNLIHGKGLTNYTSITLAFAKSISRNLDADVFIYGNIKLAGSILRLNAQITDSRTGEILKPFQIEGLADEENSFQIIDSLSRGIKNFLIISRLKKEAYLDPQHFASTTSPEAYRYFIYGQKVFGNRDYPAAIRLLSQAVAIDTNLTYATLHISFAYSNMGMYAEAKEWCFKAYRKREIMPIFQQIYTNMHYADLFETPYESIKYFKQLQEIDDHWPHLHYGLGYRYCCLNQYNRGISELEKSLDMYDKMGIKPYWSSNYYQLGVAYHKTGQFKKEKRLYKKADQDFPDEYRITARRAILALSEGDTIAGNKYIEKFIVLAKGRVNPETAVVFRLPNLYAESGMFDEAEKLYRQELSQQPENPVIINSLAYLLIDKDLNIEEGLQFAGKALDLRPDNYSYLHTKGWGLYKQGKYQEALDLLQKSWDLRIKNAIYDHEAFLHLEAAKKAVAEQRE